MGCVQTSWRSALSYDIEVDKEKNVVLMMILMLVIFVVPGPAAYHMGSHEAPGTTTQAHEHDAAKSDAGKH